MFRKVIFSLLIASSANANEQLSLNDFVCKDHEGVTVDLQFTNDDKIENEASAILVDGRGVIVFNSNFHDTLNKNNPNSKFFVYLHECAHHALGHVKNTKAFSSGNYGVYFAEANADCYAGISYTKLFDFDTLEQALSDTNIPRKRINLIKSCVNIILSD